MIWFLVIHIIALLFWCASLLYLPPLIAGLHTARIAIAEPNDRYSYVARFLFTAVATPAALVAIMAGTAVFLFNRSAEIWLIIKLTLVAGLVVGHTLVGLLLMHTQDRSNKPIAKWCRIISAGLWSLMAGILWTVLAKPAEEVLP